jgi:RHH-type proline utilization regulon transcriptional repressor/proline dehydrogenase/delta 1-pyrroline-5-carboxylate dehydrogenase
VIDADAKAKLEAHIAAMTRSATVHYAGAPARGGEGTLSPAPNPSPQGGGEQGKTGPFVAPHVFELRKPEDLTEEVFGPVLHVVRFAARDLDAVLDEIGRSGYGLTLGIHSRIDGLVERVVERLPVGNVYVNRNMIGAVVGVQPFGGHGLSGTGPKAGGPHYLLRFATEQTVTINTAAAGGNAALIALEE